MLNKIWFWLLFIGIVYAFGKGSFNTFSGRATQDVAAVSAGDANDDTASQSATGDSHREFDHRGLNEMGKGLNQAALDSAKLSVEICIGLIGIMALWLGLLRIAEQSGLVDAIAAKLRPLMRWLFPGVPDGHPAQGAMLMNMAANILGLDNAATPFGLKAMQELQTLNETDDTATNDMATFLAINTSSVTLIPFTIIGYRYLNGSENPAEPIVWIVLATAISTCVAIFVVRWLSRWPRYAIEVATANPNTVEE